MNPFYETKMNRYSKLLLASLVLVMSAGYVESQSSDPLKETQRLTRVAQVAQQEGRFEDAIKAYRKITVIAASSPKLAASAHLAIGNIYMSLGKFDEAAVAFRKSVALDSESPEAVNNLGEALGELMQYQPALGAFQRAVALNAAYLKARYNMGVTYDRLGQMKYAEFVYRILIRDFPDFALAYDSLAVSLSKSGRPREAIPFHEKAISLNSKDSSFYYNLAVSYLVLGDLRKAREQEQMVRSLDPSMAEHLAGVIAKHQP